MRRSIPILLVLVAMQVSLTAGMASADAVYHAQQIPLHPVADAPLTKGFVQNIHANGPNVFAHEVYVLAGAVPDTAFTVSIAVYVNDVSCSGTPVVFQTAELTTSAGGGGKADVFFTPEAAASLRNAMHGAIWTFSVDGAPVYQTDCSTIVLD
jgi:hypothetical protein